MRTVIELTEKDILQTIANSFDVDTNCVTLKYDEVWKGYGQNERKECEISARIITKNRG